MSGASRRPLVLALLASLVFLLGVAAAQLNSDDSSSSGVKDEAFVVAAASVHDLDPAGDPTTPDSSLGHCGALAICLAFLLVLGFTLARTRSSWRRLPRMRHMFDASIAYLRTAWSAPLLVHPTGLLTC